MKRVLVANRGEIACRIIRTLDRLGLESVAIAVDADRGAPHVSMATEALTLRGDTPAAGYRDTEQIVTAAIAAGVDAVHPGYGFLSEDATFAALVERAGIAFLGPTPDQIAAFGLKDHARSACEGADVALLAGSGAMADAASAMAAARAAIGFPVIVKSVAGGGGIGMLECRDPADALDTIEAAMRQSEQAFGTARIYVERLVDRARHVEVQVFGDGRGEVIVLGDRDCSAQRRRQKVLEEAPSPNLDPAIRAELHASAVRLLAPMRYRSAGTVEFVVDVDTGDAAFLEVNTRLQVEHPVTEAVTGIDLVEWMVRLGAGDLALRAPDPAPGGHAIEARVYAEDPAKDFLPSPGTVTHVLWPEGVRVDTWIRAGTEISPHFDPLLAKVIAHGSTREEARARLRDALAATRVDGIETNLGLLASFLGSDEMRRAEVTTASLAAHRHAPSTVDVLVPGASTTVQALPGRLGYWEVGVPPSGPMDDRSFAIGNQLLGNDPRAPGLECTVTGPTLRCNVATTICLAGAAMHATLDGEPVPSWAPVPVAAGATLTLGAIEGPGTRTYVLVAGGIDVPQYLGSAATFTLGGFGGHAGRELRAGDVLHLIDPGARQPAAPEPEVPVLTHCWEIDVVDGPHAAPDFFTERDIDELYATDWQVHYNSSRTGVRLIGPKPEWARPDGGEAGLHPSNIHDTAYVPGALDFTGDMPIILGPDGPSLGGFVCPVTIVTAELWKVGQLAPGDTVRFRRADDRGAAGADDPGAGDPGAGGVLVGVSATDDRPAVTYRRTGDRAVLVEFGPMQLDFDLRLRAHALARALADADVPGIVDLTPGIRSLQVRVDGAEQTADSVLALLRELEPTLPPAEELVVPSRIVELPLSWDDPATRDAIDRYVRSVRDDAPWCPWNIEFIRRINGLDTVDDVRRIVFDAEYLVLGLGDVYLGAPVAVPVDPRHRLVTTKYNPARTWTPENAVGIGGAYLCIYGMEGPGGYQFVGRTVPVWSTYGHGPHVDPETPWLLRHFDRIRWVPVDADTLLDMRADARAGRLELRITDSTFDNRSHRDFVARHAESIDAFQHRRREAFARERDAWERSGEFARATEAILTKAILEEASAADAADLLAELPPGAAIVAAEVVGRVACVHHDAGTTVRAGDPIVTLEAMKMEYRVSAPTDSVVERVLCRTGDMVTTGAPLAVLLPAA